MAMTTFEVRGLKFYSQSDQFAQDHMCTFSISVRVPSGKYWVAYYKWQASGATGAIHSHLLRAGNLTLIASGANVLPSLLTGDEVMPAEVLEDDSNAKLSYTRSKNSAGVHVYIAAAGSRKPVNVQFNMTEPKAAPADESLYMGRQNWDLVAKARPVPGPTKEGGSRRKLTSRLCNQVQIRTPGSTLFYSLWFMTIAAHRGFRATSPQGLSTRIFCLN